MQSSEPEARLPLPDEVRRAAERIRGVIAATPLRRSPSLSARVGGDVWLKLETEQRTGSFKLRGAYNAIASLPDDVRARGVVAASAGNHGLGLSYAARLLGVPATIFVPASSPEVKKSGIREAGARVIDDAPHFDAAEEAAKRWAAERGLAYLSPCAGDALLAGQGTVALEIHQKLPDVAAIVVGIGGGGLIGGVAGYLRGIAPGVRIVGAQTDRTDAMARSLAAGRRVTIDDVPTLADGLAGQVDDYAVAIGRLACDDIVVVSEEEVAEAIAWLWREEGVRAEGAGATPVAALLSARFTSPTPVVAVVSGGNIDPEKHRRIVEGRPAATGGG